MVTDSRQTMKKAGKRVVIPFSRFFLSSDFVQTEKGLPLSQHSQLPLFTSVCLYLYLNAG